MLNGMTPKAVALNASAGAVWLMKPRKVLPEISLEFLR
jgi:hypothetical protein